MKINIFGSTGKIGSQSLHILNKYYPKFKINLLLANSNYKKIIKQSHQYKPKFICINNKSHINIIKEKKYAKTKLIYKDDLINFIKNTKSDLTVLSISGYEALNYLEAIICNTKNIGLVNKECVVSAGHLFKKIFKTKRIKIFPLDSEHYSLYFFLKNYSHTNNSFKKVYLTASGGPFLKMNTNKLNKINFADSIAHPKWSMGEKNSFDSSTMVNKCLEIIEAHYLFDIPYDKLSLIIHPEALIHSIIEFYNYNTTMNYFYHDMKIPLINMFQEIANIKNFPKIDKYQFYKNHNMSFFKPKNNQYPIIKIFEKMNKNEPKNIIKFNCANEFAFNLFKSGKIKFLDIHKIIKYALSIELKLSVNNINKIILYQNKIMQILTKQYEK